MAQKIIDILILIVYSAVGIVIGYSVIAIAILLTPFVKLLEYALARLEKMS